MRMRTLITAVFLMIGPLLVCAEPRWCTVTGRAPNDTFFYPPIARAARVHGVVLGELVFETDGKAVRFEPISGPRLLSDTLMVPSSSSLNSAMTSVSQRSSPCASVLSVQTPLPEPLVRPEPGSVLRLSIETETEPILLDVVISDPAPLRGFKLLRAEVKWKLKRAFRWLFNSHSTFQ